MTFKVGQKVVYPNHGVSLVEKIEPGHMDGVEQVYFHLKLLGNNCARCASSAMFVPSSTFSKTGTSTPTRIGRAATSRTWTR